MTPDKERKGDLKISGSGKISGGIYRNVSISGSADVADDLIAEDVKVSGSCRMLGGVQADAIKVSGSCSIAGDVRVREIKASGAARFGGDVNAKESVKFSGSAQVAGDIRAHKIAASGRLECGGDVEGDAVRLSGIFKIGGLISADEVNIELVRGKCKAPEIGGGHIVAHAPGCGPRCNSRPRRARQTQLHHRFRR